MCRGKSWSYLNVSDHFKAKKKILCKRCDEHTTHDATINVQNCVQEEEGAYFRNKFDQIVVFGEKGRHF